MGIECMRALRLALMTVLVCVVGYTCLLLLVTSVIAPKQRMGSLLVGPSGGLIGSRLLAQEFKRPEYLWPRPSAVDYNGAGAGGSNLSPTHSKIRERAETILAIYDLPDGGTLPADLVLASGSGLDPHVTLEAALLQAERIASSRRVEASTIRNMLHERRDRSSYPLKESEGLVNVLEFNLHLDATLQSMAK